MTKHRQILYNTPLPQDFLDALQELLGTYNANVIIDQPNSTTVRVVAGTGNAQVGIAIGGLWRYNTASVTAAHPGGASGQYDIFVVGSANSFTAGGGNETDNTDYSFGLVIVAHNTTPSGTWNGHAITVTRKIGEVTWSGAAITAITNMLAQPVPTAIAPGSITQTMLANDSVGAAQMQADSVGTSELAPGSVTDVEVAAANKDGASGTASMRTLGAGAQQAVAGNDSRLSNARSPIAHAASHTAPGATDPTAIYGTHAARPAAASVTQGCRYFETDTLAAFLSDGASWLPISFGPPIVTRVAGPSGTGVTYICTALGAGTYIVSFGAGQFNSAAQGSSCSITSNATGTASVHYSDVGGAGGSVQVPGIVLTAGQVVTFTLSISGGSTVQDSWGRIERTA